MTTPTHGTYAAAEVLAGRRCLACWHPILGPPVLFAGVAYCTPACRERMVWSCADCGDDIRVGCGHPAGRVPGNEHRPPIPLPIPAGAP